MFKITIIVKFLLPISKDYLAEGTESKAFLFNNRLSLWQQRQEPGMPALSPAAQLIAVKEEVRVTDVGFK